MDDVTDTAFRQIVADCAPPDLFFTEFVNVDGLQSPGRPRLLKKLLFTEHDRPLIAQLWGLKPENFKAVAAQIADGSLAREFGLPDGVNFAGVDLNMGCPAKSEVRMGACSALIKRENWPLAKQIIDAAREGIAGRLPLSVKTRIGFDDPAVFDQLLPIFAKHSLDLLTVHGRTVKEMYRSAVHYEFIARAVAAVPCPVLANGNVSSVKKAEEVLALTGARGLMIGRGAIRNPWLFRQIREHRRGEPIFRPTGRDVLNYVHALYEAVCSPDVAEVSQVQKMKKYLNYITHGVEPTGQFQHTIRRVMTKADFSRVCAEYLDHEQPVPHEPLAMALTASEAGCGEH